jgi:hypothetical protein
MQAGATPGLTGIFLRWRSSFVRADLFQILSF